MSASNMVDVNCNHVVVTDNMIEEHGTTRLPLVREVSEPNNEMRWHHMGVLPLLIRNSDL
jgi:hypothetical protein